VDLGYISPPFVFSLFTANSMILKLNSIGRTSRVGFSDSPYPESQVDPVCLSSDVICSYPFVNDGSELALRSEVKSLSLPFPFPLALETEKYRFKILGI
jgi:hypothetical protein